MQLPRDPVAVPPRFMSAKNRIDFTLIYRIFSVLGSRGRLFFRSLRAKMEIAGQMALKPEKHSTSYGSYQHSVVFSVDANSMNKIQHRLLTRVEDETAVSLVVIVCCLKVALSYPRYLNRRPAIIQYHATLESQLQGIYSFVKL